jgi:hypothetical protein
MLRPDISKAIDTAPPHIQQQITQTAAQSLELLNTCLPDDETVGVITSASPGVDGPTNSLLALTDRRLLFVAPAPQAVGWRLATLTKTQLFGGFFFVEGDAGDYSLGLKKDEWGAEFELQVKRASATAVLRNY